MSLTGQCLGGSVISGNAAQSEGLTPCLGSQGNDALKPC